MFGKYISLINSIIKNLPKSRRKLLFNQFIYISLTAIFEMSVVAYTPIFLNVISSTRNSQIFFNTTLIYTVLVILGCIIKVLNLRKLNNTSSIIGTDLSTKAFESMLYQSYEEHNQEESNEIINGLITSTGYATRVINAFINIFSSLITLSFITVFLVYKYPKITLLLTSFLLISYFVISNISKETITKNSNLISKENLNLVKIIQEGFGSFKDTTINRTQNNFINDLYKSDSNLRKSIAKNMYLTTYPRFINETIILLLMVFLSIYFFLAIEEASTTIFSKLSIFGVAGLKLLPSVQMIYASWAIINSYYFSTKDLIKIIEKDRPEKIKLNKNNSNLNIQGSFSLILKNVFYKYPKKETDAIKDINLSFKKGDIIGIKGKSGAGKSTLIDIMMGLLKPSAGEVYFNNLNIYENHLNTIKYREIISHVPQHPYINYGTILENITLEKNNNNLDFERLEKALTLSMFKEALRKDLSLNSYLGERGKLLSGGQLQRLSIARALYRTPKILFLDEFTSALDKNNEEIILNNIIKKISKDTVIVLISHRDKPLEICNKIYNLNDGSIN